MSIKRIYVDPEDVLGSESYVSTSQDPRISRNSEENPYRIYPLDSFKERSAFLICEHLKSCPIVKGTVKIKSFEGFSIEQRPFEYDNKRYNEPVFVVDKLEVEKGSN